VPVAPFSAKIQKQYAMEDCGSGGGWVRATQKHRQPHSDPPSPDGTELGKRHRYIHLVKIKYFKDSGTLDPRTLQRNSTYKDICTVLQGASTTLHTILWWVGGNLPPHTQWSLSRTLVLNFKDFRHYLPPKSMRTLQVRC
jgi:hypothetical protein